MIRRTALIALCAALLPVTAGAEPLLLAAASTAQAVDAAMAQGGIVAVTSYGASGTLARQVEQGAPADLFISANPKWMDYLVDAGLVKEGTVSLLMSNALVLIGPEGAAAETPEALVQGLEGANFVMADPQVAPVGAYGKAALETLGLWAAVEPRLVPTRNTLATVASVASGEAALGLVYASDAAGQAGVSVLAELPADSHPPIRYLIAPVAQGEDPEGARVLQDFLLGPEGAAVLASYGFLTLEGSE